MNKHIAAERTIQLQTAQQRQDLGPSRGPRLGGELERIAGDDLVKADPSSASVVLAAIAAPCFQGLGSGCSASRKSIR